MTIYRRMAVIGCGLIGSSICLAARAEGVVGEIVAADCDPWVRARANELTLADRICADAAEAVDGADLVVLATPVGAIAEVAQAVAPSLAAGATLTDVGSVKAAVAAAMSAAAAARRDVFVVPGHPIAGTEQSGPDAGFATLFKDRWTILTPAASNDRGYDAAVARLAEFWRALGSNVEVMDETHHDLVLAVTSHLPHLIAYNIVGTAADLEAVTRSEVMKYSAGGFRDFTRIAASDPVMWRDIFLNNREAVLQVLSRFTDDLQTLADAIARSDGAALETLFTRTREIRRGIIDAGQERAVANFGRDQPDPASRG